MRIGDAGMRWRREAAALVASLTALALAVVAAYRTGAGIGPVTGGIESVSSATATALSTLVRVLPFGYALGAGVVAAFNPCGFAMLPTYLALYLGAGDAGEGRLGARISRAAQVSAAMTASFVMIFGIAGVLLSIASSSIGRYFSVLGLSVGIILVLVGGRMLTGTTLYAAFGQRLADRIGERARERSLPGYLAYGFAYGAASLSCTLPVFLVVVGSALTARGPVAGVVQFILFALGMGLVVAALTVSIALFKHAAVRRVRRALPYVGPLSAFLLLLAGAYIVYYWLTIGGILKTAGVLF
jgi:cytochrome c-type biogenesis protein